MNVAKPDGVEKFYYDKKIELTSKGLSVMPGVFTQLTLDSVKTLITDNLHLLRNTRPTPSSLHLAGFHRYPEFESLHSLLSCNKVVHGFLKYVLNDERIRNIGITDITINRSQCWHKDLLRGPYAGLMNDEEIWSTEGQVFRVVMYLQDSTSLKFVPGSHLEPVSLLSDAYAVPLDESRVSSVPVKAGDAVVMDVRTTHRGAEEADFEKVDGNPRILVATTLGADSSVFTNQLEYGNAVRLNDWMKRNQVTRA